MRKVEGNVVYDTTKSEKIAEWTNGRYWNDFGYRCKELHRTSNGKWFMYDYSYNINNSNCIEGISFEEARDFLCEVSDIDSINAFFPGYLEEA
jgi:hypothetical protein